MQLGKSLVSNKNIFYATNPARMLNALWKLICSEHVNLENVLIFLPSRRAVRAAEKMFVELNGGALILPRFVALGEGVEDSENDDEISGVSKNERVILLAKLLSADANIGGVAQALPIARDFVQMADYLENENIDITNINWINLVDEKYAQHFKSKAQLLDVLSRVLPAVMENQKTQTAVRNDSIRKWTHDIKNNKYDLVVVCGSTASVPATADLMAYIATLPNGRIILSGKIIGEPDDFMLKTNPYNSEYQFLMRIGVDINQIQEIDVGDSGIEFFDFAFGNNTTKTAPKYDISCCHLIECARESEEAMAVAEITQRALNQNKTVMVITPDSAGNQRIANAFAIKNIVADFSGGIPGTMTRAGRAILNMFDDLIEKHDARVEKLYYAKNYNLFDTISELILSDADLFNPTFVLDDETSMPIWLAIKELSDNLSKYGIVLSLSDIRAFVADVLKTVSVRQKPIDDARVVVLGTMEARMQTADVVILTGLNDGMFPSRGYENSWLPVSVSDAIGLPSRDKKVSLMSLDFMNLSCCDEVYWLRSTVSGGVQTVVSRFVSRVIARGGNFDVSVAEDILNTIRSLDVLDFVPLDYSAPCPKPDWSPVYVTEIETLIHNPYAFYVKHILRLRVMDDYWIGPDARAFGNLVHDVIEHASNFSHEYLISEMDAYAHDLLGSDNIIYRFWHKRFVQIAGLIESCSELMADSCPEIEGGVEIAGRNVRARADRVWDGGVLDIKTGEAPSKSQLLDGNMPQLPLEAFILQSGGFKMRTTKKSKTPIMLFLQLKNNDVRPIEYDAETTTNMMNAAIAKTTELFNMYSSGGAAYEYRETNEPKYHMYDDLARNKD